MNKATATYWRQVHRVQAMTGASSAVARVAVAQLREDRGYATAAETSRHPIIVQRVVDSIEDEDEEPPEGKPYADLDDWIETWEEYEGDYEYYEVETNADY